MAGAVSAGAYTAGVLDFLMEALEEWQKEKDAFRKQLDDKVPSVKNIVPLHDVCIDAITGASAGGMCAAIAAAMVQGPFQHVRTGDERVGDTNPPNTFYDSWVNQIDIREFLRTDDVAGGKPLLSLLDCTILDTIASTALKLPAQPAPRPYVSPGLSLFLMLTNVRGVTYPLYVDASMALEEHIACYGDKVRFQITSAATALASPTAQPLPVDGTGPSSWSFLREVAKATGAVPLVLAPRELNRPFSDYDLPPWKRIDDTTNIGGAQPEFPPHTPPAAQYWTTLNVDGGLTDNDPMELANDFLAMNNKSAVLDPINNRRANPPDAISANCTVLNIAPFPPMAGFNSGYFDAKAPPAALFTMLGHLLTVFLSQSRFLGETLSDLTQGAAFSRFVIAPSDPELVAANPNTTVSALQCGTLGAFGGFLDRKFRKHDFLLGRRNCQKFLLSNFLLPVGNPIIAGGLAEAGPWAGSVLHFFKQGPPASLGNTPQPPDWIPIIPLCGSALIPVAPPVRDQMTADDLDAIVDLAMQRIKAIKNPLLAGAPGILRIAASFGTSFLFAGSMKSALRNIIRKNLGGNIAP